MKILITNDDGIESQNMRKLALWASERLGQVTVVAPLYEQSGKSIGIAIRKDVTAFKVNSYPETIEAWAVDSTPADSVRFAINGLHKQFDLVITGVNDGYNVGADIIMYSGTVGAASEACLRGAKSIAISTERGNKDFDTQFETIYNYFVENKLLEKGSLFNVNIPPKAVGIVPTRQSGIYYTDAFLPKGNNIYEPEGHLLFEPNGDLSIDAGAVHESYISVTPLTLEKTDFSTLEKMK